MVKFCPHARILRAGGSRYKIEDMTEETIQAARRAWANDPEAAAQALLGCSAEELFITALRGCNQHKHKPGCPDADGSTENQDNSWASKWGLKSDAEKLASYEVGLKKAEKKAEETGKYEDVEIVKQYRQKTAKYKKKIARTVINEIDAMYNDIHSKLQNKGTEEFRKVGVNIADAAASYSNARSAALFIEKNPSSERWKAALSDMKKGSDELKTIYSKIK